MLEHPTTPLEQHPVPGLWVLCPASGQDARGAILFPGRSRRGHFFSFMSIFWSRVVASSAGFGDAVCGEAAAWLICLVNGAARGAAEGIGEVEGATYLGFLHLGGLLLPRLSGCGKWKMKGAAFPASRVTMSKAEKGGWG